MTWPALILAGSRGGTDPVAQAAGVGHKAFAPIAGQPMIAHVIAALRACGQIGAIIVAIEPDAPALPPGLTRIDAATGPSASVAAALDRLGTPLLVTTADHPLLTPAMIADFLAAATASGADVVAGICPRAIVEQAGNTGRRTYLRLSDGAFSGTNLFALCTPRARGAVEVWHRVEAARKAPWQMARMIGPMTLARYLAGWLDTRAAAAALGRVAGCRAALVQVPHADAAHDVDKPADLAFAIRRLAARTAP